MATITQTRIWNNVPTKQVIDTSTGEIKVYPTDAAFQKANPISAALGGKPPLLASSSSNKWTVDPEFSAYYNNNNPNKTLTVDAFEKAFQTAGKKVFDNDRANVLNTATNYSSTEQFENNTRAFKVLKIPRIRDPFTGISNNSNGSPQTDDVTGAIPPSGDQQGGNIPRSDDDSLFPVDPNLDVRGSVFNGEQFGPIGAEGLTFNISANLSPAPVASTETAPVLRYPLANLDVARELGITYDYIKVQVVDYVGSLSKADFQNTKGVFERYLQNQKTYAYVILPMQPNISASNSTSWGEDSANILQLVAGSIANKYFQNTGNEGFVGAAKQAATNIYQSANQLVETSVNLKADIAALLAGYVTNTNLLQRATGSVINPNMEMLFNGPRLRSFNFTFDMTPRFKEEAEEIRKIIKVFKKYMAPKKEGDNAFLKAPKIFLLNYIYNGDVSESEIDSPWISNPKDHPYLNKIKPCALTNFDVNYTPSGSYMTYSDGGSMTTYQITMTFSEIEPIYENDIDLASNHMGY